jgi:hypothetical protein
MSVSTLTSTIQTTREPHPWSSCYIAAPDTVRLQTLKDLLGERGIEPIILNERPAKRASVFEQVASAIEHADFVVAVLDHGASNANIYFEIGYARAIGKTVLVLAPPKTPVPADIGDLPLFKASVEDRDAIGFAIDQILIAPVPTRHVVRDVVSASKPLGPLANAYIDELTQLGAQATESALVDIVVRALEASGEPHVVADHSTAGDIAGAGRRADIAVWSDELISWGGSPVIIDIKRELTSQRDIDQARSQVAQYLSDSNSRLGLVLYLVGPSTRGIDTPFSPQILFMSVGELLSQLAHSNFGSIIRVLRNSAIHGTGQG